MRARMYIRGEYAASCEGDDMYVRMWGYMGGVPEWLCRRHCMWLTAGERQRHPWMVDTCQGATPCGLHIASVKVCPGDAGIKKLCQFLVGTAHISGCN